MAYDKHTWISGETITATELNDMESGIENNSERLDELTETVNKNTTDIDGKLDKSSVTSSLTSTSTTDALAASAGKTLNDALSGYFFGNVSLSSEQYELTAGESTRLRFRGADIQEKSSSGYYLIFLKYANGNRSLLANVRLNATDFSCDEIYNTTGASITATNARYLIVQATVSGIARAIIMRYN